MSSTETITKIDSAITRRSRAFELQYRHKSRFGASQGGVRKFLFWFDGNLKEAVERARQHCIVMDYQFIYCTPAIVDLEAREESKKKGDFAEGEE